MPQDTAVEPTAFINANVVTVDDTFSLQQAFTVRGGRIEMVGSTDEVLGAIGPEHLVVDLDGRTVLPGFIDAHAHSVLRAVGKLASPSLAGLGSVKEIVAAVEAAASHADPGAWIVTSSIGEPPDHFGLPEGLAEGRWPTRYDLDAAAPDNPVYIPTPIAWPNPAIFNSAALQALHLRAGDRDDGVRCEVDEGTGELTGVVHGISLYNRESEVVQRLSTVIPRHDSEVVAAAVATGLSENLTVGVTSIYEGHLNSYLTELRSLHAAGQLANRVVCTYEVDTSSSVEEIDRWFGELSDARGAGSGDEMLKVLGATVSLDGAIQFGKALMRQPYLDPDGRNGNGASSLSAAQLAQVAELAVQHDIRLNVLAAGSGAIGIAVQALREVHARHDLTERRWVMQHVQHPSREEIAELAAMGFVAQTYASVDYSKGIPVYLDRLVEGLWESTVPLRWWIDGGVTIAQGSDGAHNNPLFQIWESLRRVDGRTGRSLMAPPKEVSRAEAIATYTINGAILMQCEEQIGSLEPGKLADFVVLDKNILTCPTNEIRTISVLATVLGGSPVHDPDRLLTNGASAVSS